MIFMSLTRVDGVLKFVESAKSTAYINEVVDYVQRVNNFVEEKKVCLSS